MKNSPYKFSCNDIYDKFSNNFQINHIEYAVYQGTLDPLPKALFSVMKLIKNKKYYFIIQTLTEKVSTHIYKVYFEFNIKKFNFHLQYMEI